MMNGVVLGDSGSGFQRVRDGIDGSACFLVLGSPGYFSDARCFLHFEYACEQKKKIGIVMEENKDIPADFQKLLDVYGVVPVLYIRGDGETFSDAMKRAASGLLGIAL